MLIFGSIYFYIDGVPVVSNFVVKHLPISVDIEVGKEVRKEIRKVAPIDEVKSELLSEFYSKLNYDKTTKLYVVNANEFNAFALPDNSIFVFDKVLKDLNSYTELSALLGHEYTHIKERHGMKGIAQSISWELLGKLITGGDNSNNFVRYSNKLLSLKNSRGFELSADIGGLALLREHNIDQNGMKALFELMLKLPQERDNTIPSYLNTHPDTEERLENVEKIISDNPSDFKTDSTLLLIFQKLKLKSN